ncbi:NUDIX hydrolase domain-like protein [Cladorrhinum samala]|uniref:NUDIX hydrolase domain-like protein n=1 Tax=Cladorrhinum samala TaxID=585594 RepID=A0AAV9I1F0_9PEZI|nr:NUDIX hydrolase domain-like protein [Cladorrhinum samala]
MATSIPYTYPSSALEEFAVPLASYLQTHPTLDGLVVSALIFHPGSSSSTSDSRRLLLIQRAATDGFPLKWECPGGGAEQADATILGSLCREVGEETGLKVTKVLRKSDALDEWVTREGGRWRKITFVVEVEAEPLVDDTQKRGNKTNDAPPPQVMLNPEEHQDFYWASLDEVQNCRFDDGRDIDFAYDAQRGTILELFD